MDNIFMFLILLFLLFQNSQRDPFEKEHTVALKGICALAIVFRHLLGNGQDPISEKLFCNGFLFVAVFFLVSGYGYSLQLKNNLCKFNSLWNRLVKIIVPFCMVAIIQTIMYAITDYNFDFKNWIPGSYIPYSWYVYAILLFYVTYCGIGCIKKRGYRVIVFGMLLATYVAICAFMLKNVGISWYMAVGALWAGVVLGEFPETKAIILKHQNLTILICAAGYVFCIRWYDWCNIRSCIFQNLTVIFFAILLLFLSAKVNIVNKATNFGGGDLMSCI